jgi:hypothetical protein
LKLADAIRGYSIPVADFNAVGSAGNLFSPAFEFRDVSSPDVVSWSWDFGDGTQSSVNTSSITHSYAASVTGNDYFRFTPMLIVTTRYGCIDTAYRTVEVRPEFTFYVPNAFTPNDDVSNREFFAKGMGIVRYKMRIFDRWGLQLWSCEEEGSNLLWDGNGAEGMSSACRWNGIYEGSPVEADVYVWQVDLTDVFGKDHSYTGRVTVAY